MPLAATWINLEMIILITVSQIEKDKCNVTYNLNLKKNDTNKLICKTSRVTDIENRGKYIEG